MADDAVKKFLEGFINSGEQVFHAAHLDVASNVRDSAVAEIAETIGATKYAKQLKTMVALRHTDVNRAHFMEEFDKRLAEQGLSPYTPSKQETFVTPAAPPVERVAFVPESFPQIEHDKIIEEQRLLKAAGYGDMLARHGEPNGGVDGLRGRDTQAAEAEFRKEHHLAADADILSALKGMRVSTSAAHEARPPATPSVPKAAKPPNLREV